MHELSVIPRFFQDGGIFMYPIAAVLAVGVAIGIERWIYLSRVKLGSVRFWNQVVPMLSSGRIKEAAALTAKSNTAIGTIMNYGLARIHSARRRDDVDRRAADHVFVVVRPHGHTIVEAFTHEDRRPLHFQAAAVVTVIHHVEAILREDRRMCDVRQQREPRRQT